MTTEKCLHSKTSNYYMIFSRIYSIRQHPSIQMYKNQTNSIQVFINFIMGHPLSIYLIKVSETGFVFKSCDKKKCLVKAKTTIWCRVHGLCCQARSTCCCSRWVSPHKCHGDKSLGKAASSLNSEV